MQTDVVNAARNTGNKDYDRFFAEMSAHVRASLDMKRVCQVPELASFELNMGNKSETAAIGVYVDKCWSDVYKNDSKLLRDFFVGCDALKVCVCACGHRT